MKLLQAEMSIDVDLVGGRLMSDEGQTFVCHFRSTEEEPMYITLTLSISAIEHDDGEGRAFLESLQVDWATVDLINGDSVDLSGQPLRDAIMNTEDKWLDCDYLA